MATCFHHPDRETGRACTRCGRPACPDCLIQAPVGSQCFECVKRGAPKGTVRIRQTLQRDPLIATKVIVGVTIAAFVFIAIRDQRVDGNGITSFDLGLVGPELRNGQWWRLFTYSFVHFGLVHIAGNLLVLWIVGREFEPGTGPLRFATLYVVSVLGGAAGALIASGANSYTGGASGGVFGVTAAAALVMHRRGVRVWEGLFGPLIIINLLFGLFISNVSIGGHIGGMVAGGLTAEAMIRARKIDRPVLGYLAGALIAGASVLIAFAVVQ
jgi:membrane associated rhomboid family serine protease